MDTDLAEHLMDLKEGMGRIDERTSIIQDNQQALRKSLIHHEERDRVDFEKIHGRINKSDKKLSYLMGGCALLGVIITIGVGIASVM